MTTNRIPGGKYHLARIIGAVAIAALVLAAGVGGYYAGVESVDRGVQLAPNETVVNADEALSQKNGLVTAEQGPTGNVTFECDDETCDVGVDVDAFHEFPMLYVTAYMDGETLKETYLHPGDETAAFQSVPVNASLTVAVPVETGYRYWWRHTYSLSWRSDMGDRSEKSFDAKVIYSIINEEYFFHGPPENSTETNSSDTQS